MICTLVRLDTGLAFVQQATLETNSDSSVSFLLPDGGYAGQEPNQYAVRHDQAAGAGAPQQYQRAQMNGNVVTFVTRPGDLPCSYFIGQGQVFPA